jgi:tetratricopeptide (TPR) repeat protein
MKRFLPFVLGWMVCLAPEPRLAAQTQPTSAANGQSKTARESQPPAQSSSNPFPEDTSTVPVMPSKTTSALPEGSYNGADNAPLPLPGDDLDPISSPDDPAPASNSGSDADSSSSLSGMERLLPRPEDDQPEKKKKHQDKEPTHEEASSEDIDVGKYYLQTKNWKAALSRFESAMVLDPENPEVYWGMAEAEHHLGDYADAKAHYLKLLDYDPDGPHGKQARKELKDPALEKALVASPSQPGENPPK